ncbi:TPA: hypothetical protein ACTY2Z_000166 [Klebsiella aerogenes]
MTKSTITRERAEQLANFKGAPVTRQEEQELARIALAAMDSEPVAWTDERNLGYVNRGREMAYLWGKKNQEESDIPLYRHAQPAPEYPEILPCAVLLEPGMRFGKGVKTRLVLDAIQRRAEYYAELEAMTPEERAEHNANIEAFKTTLPQPAPVVPDDLLSMAASAIEDLLEHTDPNTSYYSGVWADVPGKLRAAMLQAEPVTTTNKLGNSPTPVPSREKFISLCNEFWNWSEMDLVCADDRGYELRMEWNGKVFSHPITQALWRMYQAAPGNSPVIPDTWISVSERMPEKSRGVTNIWYSKRSTIV